MVNLFDAIGQMPGILPFDLIMKIEIRISNRNYISDEWRLFPDKEEQARAKKLQGIDVSDEEELKSEILAILQGIPSEDLKT
jgi:hypothetical protein